jgi:predicted nucleic acid-binding protein
MPEQGGAVVVNSTPIIALALAGKLDLLRLLYREVVIPEAVRAEVLRGGRRRIGAAELERADWIRTTPLKDARRADLLSDLDRGEAEVLALAQELETRLVIIDERLGRRHARRLGLALTGTLGVLLRSKSAGHVAAVGPSIERIRAGGIRLSDALVQRTLDLAGE